MLIRSLLKGLGQLIIEVTSSLELLDTLKVFFFLHDALVKLLLDHTVLLLRTFKLPSASLYVCLDDLLDILKIVEQDFLCFLCSRLFVGVVNFDQVVLLL